MESVLEAQQPSQHPDSQLLCDNIPGSQPALNGVWDTSCWDKACSSSCGGLSAYQRVVLCPCPTFLTRPSFHLKVYISLVGSMDEPKQSISFTAGIIVFRTPNHGTDVLREESILSLQLPGSD